MKTPTVKVSREWLLRRLAMFESIRRNLYAEVASMRREEEMMKAAIAEHDLAESSRAIKGKKGGKQ